MNDPGRTEAYTAEDRATMTGPACAFLDQWLATMDTALAEWRRAHLPAGFPFDFGLDSLDALEPLLLSRFPDRAAIDAASNADFTTGAVRYIGETLLRAVPARWGYEDRGAEDTHRYNRVPVVRSNTPAAFMEAVAPCLALHVLVRDRGLGTLRQFTGPLLDAHEAAELAGG
ncbi:hypothetical protein ABZ545_00345 [Streptomyces abikoensis]|uniref:hypothetical protein n=1 Tax=Streptomyces abikoensis TaxID=97398 RepID=UPI0033EA6C21